MGGRPIASLICVTIVVLPHSPDRIASSSTTPSQIIQHVFHQTPCSFLPHCCLVQRSNSHRRQLCCWPCPWSSCRGCHLSARTVLPFVNFCPGSKVEKKLWLALAPAGRPPHSTPQ